MWMISIIALWVLVLFETVLLVLLLRALGEMRQRGNISTNTPQPPDTWGLEVGSKAPPFTAKDQYGNTVNFEDFLGRKLVLAFISPGCSACEGVVSALNTLASERNDLLILAVSDPNVERNHAYAVEHHAQVPILAAAVSVEEKLYRVRGVPFVFVIDETNIIRTKGAINEGERLRTLIETAFGQVTAVH